MGHRLSRIVTRTGDAGSTGLADNTRVGKTDMRIAALGEVDELNCQIGVVLSLKPPRGIAAALARIQNELFDLGGEISLPGAQMVSDEYLTRLETDAQTFNKKLPPLKEFVLPGGNQAAAAAHLARAVCRRAERALWTLHGQSPLNPNAPRYLNRLSDLLFIVARTLARTKNGKEVLWKRSPA